jgi:hypothetical protein
MELSHLHDTDVWLFSASGDNHDILGALTAARHRAAKSVTIITSNPDARLIHAAEGIRDLLILVTPRAEPKDGFLATHSLVGALVSLLLAAGAVAHEGQPSDLPATVVAATQTRLSQEARRNWREALSSAASAAVAIVLYDPRLHPAATLLETSLWEAAALPVQTTDFRNFAHGRHVWLAKRPDVFLLALTGAETRAIWNGIDSPLPPTIPRLDRDYGRCSRLDGYLALLDGFAIVETLSAQRGVDPGKPGTGDFARPIYEADGLARLSSELTPPVRQKRLTRALIDETGVEDGDLPAAHRKVIERLSSTRFGGLVLDYDGTVVATEKRLEPPTAEMVARLTELLAQGLRLGIATGRGGSAGESLRDLLPEHHHHEIVMGYYNGAFIKPLSVDISLAQPEMRPAIRNALAWMRSRPDLFSGTIKDSPLQVTISKNQITSEEAFLTAFAQGPFEGHQHLKVVQSRHSYDLCLMEACKTNVVNTVQLDIPSGLEVLCIGDRGDASGNDHVMLGLPFGISVDHVCSREHAGWSLFGAERTGPDALLRILDALGPVDEGGFALQPSLLLDAPQEKWHKAGTHEKGAGIA